MYNIHCEMKSVSQSSKWPMKRQCVKKVRERERERETFQQLEQCEQCKSCSDNGDHETDWPALFFTSRTLWSRADGKHALSRCSDDQKL